MFNFKDEKRIVVITSKLNLMNGDRNSAYGSTEEKRLEVDWLRKRIDIFMNFTLKALIGQSNQNFVALYAYQDETEELIKNIFSNYESLPDNIRFVKKTSYMDELNKITKGYDILFLARLDSDDLYRYDFVERILEYKIKENQDVILCQNGYIYSSEKNILAEYYHHHLTFYTVIYRLQQGEDKYKSFEVEPFDLLLNFSHHKITNYNYEPLEGRNFIFLIHGENANSTFWDYDFGFSKVGRHIENNLEKESILFDFL
ncbi:MAG: glycosyltransferase [Sarcina sp.]